MNPGAATKGIIRAGVSGWKYPEWRGNFYPPGLVQRRELSYLAERLTTVELNSPFYRLMRPSTYQSWKQQVPENFRFAVKGWKQITHLNRLKNPAEALAQFFSSGVLDLGQQMGPILWQLPPSLRFDQETLSDFCRQLPKSTAQAAAMTGSNTPVQDSPILYALEPRNASFTDPAAAQLLEEYGIALVTSDNPGRWAVFDQVTAPFVYWRLHGKPKLYHSTYTDQQLAALKQKAEDIAASGTDVYCYFDNTAAGHAPANAIALTDNETLF